MLDIGVSKGTHLLKGLRKPKEPVGRWRGKGSAILGLKGAVRKAQFAALAYNRRPGTTEYIADALPEKRTVSSDFIFSASESVTARWEDHGRSGRGREAAAIVTALD